MLSSKTRIFVVSLGLMRALVVLGLTITGPSSAQFNGTMTITWESVPADPTVFNIELVAVANGEGAQEIANEIPTQGGGLTMGFDPLALPPPGEYSQQFVNVENVGQIYAESTIEILASTGTSSPPATSSPPTSSPPPGSTRPTSSSPGTASSPPATGTSLSRSPAAKHDRNAHAITGGVVGAIVGGVVGAIAAIIIVLLGWWYLPRRRRASQRFRGTEAPRFLAAPVSTSLAGTPAAHSGPDNREFHRWEGSAREATAEPSASTKPLPLVPPTAPAGDVGSSNVKNPIVLRWDPPSGSAPQPESTPAPQQVQPELPSRVEELADEVRRLREHIGALFPPSYSGPDMNEEGRETDFA